MEPTENIKAREETTDIKFQKQIPNPNATIWNFFSSNI
jgi:hypothetical protein